MIGKTSFENCKSLFRRTVCQKSPASKRVLLKGGETGGGKAVGATVGREGYPLGVPGSSSRAQQEKIGRIVYGSVIDRRLENTIPGKVGAVTELSSARTMEILTGSVVLVKRDGTGDTVRGLSFVAGTTRPPLRTFLAFRTTCRAMCPSLSYANIL
jgi:hypothetical protein